MGFRHWVHAGKGRQVPVIRPHDQPGQSAIGGHASRTGNGLSDSNVKSVGAVHWEDVAGFAEQQSPGDGNKRGQLVAVAAAHVDNVEGVPCPVILKAGKPHLIRIGGVDAPESPGVEGQVHKPWRAPGQVGNGGAVITEGVDPDRIRDEVVSPDHIAQLVGCQAGLDRGAEIHEL